MSEVGPRPAAAVAGPLWAKKDGAEPVSSSLPAQAEPPSPDRTVKAATPERSSQAVKDWFDAASIAALPARDGRLSTARAAAVAFAASAKAENTRRAYRAGVRAWCDWCDAHALPCLPARSADVAAFLSAERLAEKSPATLQVRLAAIRYLHFAAGLAVPTGDACVAEAMAGIRRHAAETGEAPDRKVAATAQILRQLLAPIPDDLRGLRDKALLLVGYAGALRRSELASIHVQHLEPGERGVRLTLPVSKGERGGKRVIVPLPYGETELCPVRALERWQQAAAITEGPVFRRIWMSRSPPPGVPPPPPRLGDEALDARSVARIVQSRALAAGFGRQALGGHSLKRGALTDGMDQGVHPTRLKKLARHKSYAVLGDYLEFGDLFDSHPLSGIL